MMKERLFLKHIPTLKPIISGKMAIQPPVIIELPDRLMTALGSCKRHGGRIKTITQLKNFPSLEFCTSSGPLICKDDKGLDRLLME